MADMRDRFEESKHAFDDLGQLAHELYDSDAFEADLTALVRDLLAEHASECGVELDTTAMMEFEDQVFKNGRGGLFMIRNGVLTNDDADIEEGDIIKMENRRDEDTDHWYAVYSAKPDRTYTSVLKINTEEKSIENTPSKSPGLVMHNNRYEVYRKFRGENGHSAARSLLEELTNDEDDEWDPEPAQLRDGETRDDDNTHTQRTKQQHEIADQYEGDC